MKGKLKPPTLHVGQAAVERYCPGGESVAGCFDWGDLDGRGDRLTSYTPGRIVVDDLNFLDVLHELAHAIDAHQWLRWPGDPDPEPGTAAFKH